MSSPFISLVSFSSFLQAFLPYPTLPYPTLSPEEVSISRGPRVQRVL
jgi:hypothetical protein